ncbi:MAG: hypothetical protein A2075_17030 [Geobacteraceae bacterium GWC2_58_44]|nr:MAG: hypothetical protein A2075_17030 [Geobacteraceae bacterium GWC2_58_44]HBG07012.1 hypothetical protein [Geobacter sp.]
MGSNKFILMTVMALGLVSAPAWLQAEESLPVIKGIRVFRSGDDLGVEISADKKFEYKYTKMPQLLRVIIDLPGTETGRPDTVYKYKSAIISTVSLEKKTVNDVQVSRVSINLTEDADFSAPTDSADKTKLTFYLRKPAAGSTAGTAAAKPGSGPEGKPAAARPAAPSPASASAHAPTPTPASAHASSPAPAPVSATAPKSVLKPVVPVSNQPVTVTGVHCGADAIEIRSSGNISEFKAFTLQQPGRLVMDIQGARSTLSTIVIAANPFGVLKARIAPFEGKLRLVFDTGAKPFPRYEVVKTGTGLRIVSRVLTEGK